MSRRQKSARQLLYNTPHPTPEEKIARVLGGRGKHLYEIQLIDGTSTLATLPPRFRNVVWVKRGGYVIVLPVEGENKIGAEIVHVLLNEHIKQLRAEGIWPKEFDESPETAKEELRISGGADEEDDIFINDNRVTVESSSDEDDDEDD